MADAAVGSQGSSKGWRKSSKSAPERCCLEVKYHAGRVILRDSKNGPASSEQPVIKLLAADWDSFLEAVRRDQLRSSGGPLTVTFPGDGGAVLRAKPDQTCLSYTTDEWQAFVGGVCEGELTSTSLGAPASAG